MAYTSSGTPAKATTGASMSKYDVEIDSRVAKLEAAVKKLQADLATHTAAPAASAGGVDVAELETQVNKMRGALGM